MGERYRRSTRLKYKKRRQQVGFSAFAALMACILGGLLLFGIDPSQRASGEERASVEEGAGGREGGGELIRRSETPTVEKAPEVAKDAKDEKEAADKKAADEPAVVPVPDIPYNATEAEAKEMLEGEGLELGEVLSEPNDDYDKGGVFYQDPLPNVEVEEGSEVGITTSSGPEPKTDASDIPDPGTTELYLTVPKMGLYGDYVANASDEGTLMNGAGKITETGFPWQESANTYIASHVYGYEGTGSWQHFAALPAMTYGDEVILSDANGTEYTYQVSNIVTVMPTDTWVTEPVVGKDMVSLQTCVGPGWSERMVVQAERVDVSTA